GNPGLGLPPGLLFKCAVEKAITPTKIMKNISSVSSPPASLPMPNQSTRPIIASPIEFAPPEPLMDGGFVPWNSPANRATCEVELKIANCDITVGIVPVVLYITDAVLVSLSTRPLFEPETATPKT